jgi:hypothetical protein
MSIHYRRITLTGVLAFLAAAGAGCRSQILRHCDQCSPYIVASAPADTNASFVDPGQQYTAVLSRSSLTTDQLAREISGMHGDINRLRREVGQVEDDVNEIKTRLRAKTLEKPLG